VALPPHADLVARLEQRMARPLPGLDAQLTMAPSFRGDPAALVATSEGCRRAAVLVLLYPLAGGTGFVLTLRQKALKAHSGQVSFPGGRIDEGETAEEAALREGEEEVGVAAGLPRVLGLLTELYIPPSHFCVSPVVAALEEAVAFHRQREEVATIIEVPLSVLLNPETRTSAVRRLHGQDAEVPYYAISGYEVWGATAMMLAELEKVVRECARDS
jgi:8-oxo-dGTP pyrophosphatase MutT (NUDIX family)